MLDLIQSIESSDNIEEYKGSAQDKFNSFFTKYGSKISSVIGIISNLTSIAGYFNI